MSKKDNEELDKKVKEIDEKLRETNHLDNTEETKSELNKIDNDKQKILNETKKNIEKENLNPYTQKHSLNLQFINTILFLILIILVGYFIFVFVNSNIVKSDNDITQLNKLNNKTNLIINSTINPPEALSDDEFEDKPQRNKIDDIEEEDEIQEEIFDLSELEKEVVNLINTKRESYKIPKYEINMKLSQINDKYFELLINEGEDIAKANVGILSVRSKLAGIEDNGKIKEFISKYETTDQNIAQFIYENIDNYDLYKKELTQMAISIEISNNIYYMLLNLY